MNIKFSSDAVRCRVSRAELDRLLTGRAVVLEVPLPRNHVFKTNVWPGAIGGWQLESDPTGIWITIPKAELQALAESLPSKEGIEREFDTMDGKIRVIFEVDVRQSRPAQDPDQRSSQGSTQSSTEASPQSSTEGSTQS